MLAIHFSVTKPNGEQCVSALFYWDCIERQVRIEGVAEKVPQEMSDAYFASRPRLSQIGAWASKQSSQIKNRSHLLNKYNDYSKKFENKGKKYD